MLASGGPPMIWRPARPRGLRGMAPACRAAVTVAAARGGWGRPAPGEKGAWNSACWPGPRAIVALPAFRNGRIENGSNFRHARRRGIVAKKHHHHDREGHSAVTAITCYRRHVSSRRGVGRRGGSAGGARARRRRAGPRSTPRGPDPAASTRSAEGQARLVLAAAVVLAATVARVAGSRPAARTLAAAHTPCAVCAADERHACGDIAFPQGRAACAAGAAPAGDGVAARRAAVQRSVRLREFTVS